MKHIYTARHDWDAQMVRDILVTNGIEARLDGPLSGNRYWTSGGVVILDDADEARALEVLRGFDPEISERPPATQINWPWRCTECGETIEQQFDVCWNCSAPREST
jgi:hypothetical protein